MKWSRFTAAADDLMHYAKIATDEQMKAQALIARTILMESMKFYLPSSSNVLEGRAYAEVMDCLELPYDGVAILSEADLFGSPQGKVVTETITIAFSAYGELNKRVRFCDFDAIHFEADEQPWCVVLPLVYEPDRKAWLPPLLGYFILKKGGALKAHFGKTRAAEMLVERLGADRAYEEVAHDTTTVANLCAMLALKNVRHREVACPKKINEKRDKKGRLPLYSYHVLEVDGELWDAPESAKDASDRVTRSHLRRGHIRRLSDGRRVWVRATFVHGKAAGFVHKDYKVAPCLQSA
jgi:hypothetical protein